MQCNFVPHVLSCQQRQQHHQWAWQAIQQASTGLYQPKAGSTDRAFNKLHTGSHTILVKSAKTSKYYIEYFSSVGGQSTERAHASWLIVTRGFSGHHVFHNDMERSLDMHTRGHPALSLLIPDSSFSLDSTRVNYQTRLWVLLDKGESQGTWTRTHTHAHTNRHTHTIHTELLFSIF